MSGKKKTSGYYFPACCGAQVIYEVKTDNSFYPTVDSALQRVKYDITTAYVFIDNLLEGAEIPETHEKIEILDGVHVLVDKSNKGYKNHGV